MLKKIVKGAAITLAIAVVGLLLVATDEDQMTRKNRKRFDLKEGDLVQWESMGTLMFPQPKIISRIENDDKFGYYVFVEGVSTGIPADQIIKLG